jgi:hypothetical protein
MTYEIIQPPFTLQFTDMLKSELNAYFDWFQNQISKRVAILESAVRGSVQYKDWSADFSVESLNLLGEWYAAHVETRARSSDEKEKIEQALTIPISVPDQELTNKTFSQAMDVGMYLAGVFKKEFPGLRWNMSLKNKKYVDYGQPVLIGFKGDVPFNPVRMMVVLAYGIAKKTRSSRSLRELFDIWAQLVI